MVVLPSVVVASETERLSSFSPHPCKDVETKDPTKMATWHAACASLSLETAVNTALMTLCLEMLGKSHAYLTTLESGQLTLSPRFQLPWRRNLNKAQYNNKTPCKMAITDHTESQIAMKIQKKTANYFNAKPCKVYIYMYRGNTYLANFKYPSDKDTQELHDHNNWTVRNHKCLWHFLVEPNCSSNVASPCM